MNRLLSAGLAVLPESRELAQSRQYTRHAGRLTERTSLLEIILTFLENSKARRPKTHIEGPMAAPKRT